MGDPVSERAHYLAVGGEGNGDLFLIQEGRVEHLGLVRASRRPEPREAEPPVTRHRPCDGLRRALGHALALALALAV
ncbi:MAG: hypothetical protein HY359_03210 [Candidatus Rokubacteria bacterium]|nr:hypothetical protein [Candidatus Rokubacteria bacterium]